jgi:hypothetical protein
MRKPGLEVADMHRYTGNFAGVISAFLFTLPALAAMQDGTRWTATSTTAMAITGDIVVSENAITFGNGDRLEIEPAGGDGTIYRLKTPSDPELLNGNRLCGAADPVRYVVLTMPSEDSLSMAVFNTAEAPGGENDDTCAIYNYER